MSKPSPLQLIRKRVITGFLIVAPLGATIFILKWLFSTLAVILAPVVERILGVSSPLLQAALSILLLFCLLYLIGLMGSNLTGRWLIGQIESIVERIPLVNAIYASIRKVIQTFSHNASASFERVVWVEFPTPGAYALGFVTGQITEGTGKAMIKVFVPTAPNPTSGFLILLEPKSAIESGLTVEEALQTIISGGLVSPASIKASLLATDGK